MHGATNPSLTLTFLSFLTAALAGCSLPTGDVLARPGSGSSFTQLTVGSGGIFAVSQDSSTTSLCRLPLAGGACVTIDPQPAFTSFLQVDEDSLFYGGTSGTASAITRVPP